MIEIRLESIETPPIDTINLRNSRVSILKVYFLRLINNSASLKR